MAVIPVAVVEDYCVFAGGIGTKAGVAKAGGCTLAWLKAQNYNPAKMFGTNGGCLYSDAEDYGPVLDVSWKFTWTGLIEVGMCAWIEELLFGAISSRYKITANPASGKYVTGYEPSWYGMTVSFVASTKKINFGSAEADGLTEGDKISVPSPSINAGIYTVASVDEENYNWVTVSEELIDNETIAVTIVPAVSVYVGGAYSSLALASAAANISAAAFNVFVFTNKPETLAATITPAGGSVAKMTWVRIIGYNTTCLDMREDGAYYESAFTVHKNTVPDETKCVKLDCNAGNFHGLSVAVSNVQIENLYFYNILRSADTRHTLYFSGTIYNFAAVNCRFDKGNRLKNSSLTGGCFCMHDCWVGNDWVETGPTYRVIIIAGEVLVSVSNCVLGSSGANAVFMPTKAIQIVNSIFYKSYKAVWLQTAASAMKVSNCIFIDSLGCALNINVAICSADFINCIFIGNSVSVPFVKVESGKYGGVRVSHCCIVAANGNQLTDKYALQSGQQDPEEIGVIEVDPQFVDYANRDYRLLPGSPCKGTGYSSGGVSVDMGIVQKQSVFRGMRC